MCASKRGQAKSCRKAQQVHRGQAQEPPTLLCTKKPVLASSAKFRDEKAARGRTLFIIIVIISQAKPEHPAKLPPRSGAHSGKRGGWPGAGSPPGIPPSLQVHPFHFTPQLRQHPQQIHPGDGPQALSAGGIFRHNAENGTGKTRGVLWVLKGM